MYLLLCWTALYFGIRYYESQQQQQEAVLKAVALAQESQLKMLRYQLNPHFLFNTLNAISTLILDNQNRTANHAISRLSEFLRYTLDQDPMKKVTLRQEIEALDLYLGTERLRFGDRLRLEYAIEGPALECLLPSLLLQPLLENSLKYAVSPREQGGCIRIEGRARGSMLEVSVIDDGPGMRDRFAPNERRGVGLRNTRERLAALPCAAGAADAVHVIFVGRRDVVVDDVGDVGNVDATRCDVCRHQNLYVIVFELRERALTLALIFVAVN